MRLSPTHRRNFIKRLRCLGWKGPEAGGKHQYMIKGAMKLPIPNPHGSGEISVGRLRELLREIDVSIEEWNRAN
jgi:hypothetical protein